MINTITELIEHMHNEEIKRIRQGKEISGGYGVIKYWFNELKSEHIVRYYNELYGMTYVLEATYYISSKEADNLRKELEELMKEAL